MPCNHPLVSEELICCYKTTKSQVNANQCQHVRDMIAVFCTRIGLFGFSVTHLMNLSWMALGIW